jgi:ubiquinone/menaquinone biosynthesis C-methylase UbiE
MHPVAETERVRRILDKQASGYDRQVTFFERILFAGGRKWVCSQARGKALELVCGTARNLRFYPEDAELTGIELSPEMLAIGHRRAQDLSRHVDLRVGDTQQLESLTPASTPSRARWAFARLRTPGVPPLKPSASCVLAASC